MSAAGETVNKQFVLRNAITRVLANGDSLPTAVFVCNGLDTAVTCPITNLATGVYRVSVVVPSTCLTGDEIALRVSAQVAGVPGTKVIDLGEVEPRSALPGTTVSTDWGTNLVTARSNLAAKLAEISANPKPNYSVDGQSFSWTQYYEFLLRQIDALNQTIVDAGGPFEVLSQGVT